MNVVLWILAVILGVAFIGAGILKALRTKEQLVASGLGWTEDFSANQVKAIGVIEALGGLGLILPALVNIAPILVPIAATGLAIAMALAVVVHVRRGEMSGTVPAAVLVILSAIVAWGRFGPYSF